MKRAQRFTLVILAGTLLTAWQPARAAAQAKGAGTTAAQVLQLQPGARAAALSGAYAASAADADVVFYNPAGAAALGRAAGLAYERHVGEVTVGSAAGALRVGPVAVAAGLAFLDAGEIDVYEPDPDFGGQRGRPTGATASASESAARLAVAVPLGSDGRLRFGAAAGVVSSDLAGLTRSAPLVDLGAQYVMGRVTVGAAGRNLGGKMSGAGAAEAPLPSEARIGASMELTRAANLGLGISADFIARLNEGTSAVATGIEAGLLPGGANRIGAVARVGYSTEAGDAGLGPLRLGAGMSVGPVSVDYAYQSMDYLGVVHRVGVRWHQPAR